MLWLSFFCKTRLTSGSGSLNCFNCYYKISEKAEKSQTERLILMGQLSRAFLESCFPQHHGCTTGPLLAPLFHRLSWICTASTGLASLLPAYALGVQPLPNISVNPAPAEPQALASPPSYMIASMAEKSPSLIPCVSSSWDLTSHLHLPLSNWLGLLH